jgi:HAD superfamily hydrolase (TIGR01458 family)
MKNLRSIRLFLFDLDGVLSVGKENPRYLGGRELVKQLKESGKKMYVVTNDSTHLRGELLQNLTNFGFPFREEEILTSSYLTALYLKEKFGRASFYLIGERGLRGELEAAGHYEGDKPQVVVVGFDRQLSYQKLDNALRLLRADAQLVGSYGGAVFMSDTGPALSAGPIIKALEFGSEKRATMIGKPSPRMFKLALKLAGEKAERAVMIGDQIETDVIGARKAGVHTVLVRTGVETAETIRRSRVKADIVVDNVDSVERLL